MNRSLPKPERPLLLMGKVEELTDDSEKVPVMEWSPDAERDKDPQGEGG